MIKLGIYQHYKGNNYEVIGECKHSETQEKFVVYRALYGEYGLWVRPYDMFIEKITLDGNNHIDRFKYISSSKEEIKSWDKFQKIYTLSSLRILVLKKLAKHYFHLHIRASECRKSAFPYTIQKYATLDIEYLKSAVEKYHPLK